MLTDFLKWRYGNSTWNKIGIFIIVGFLALGVTGIIYTKIYNKTVVAPLNDAIKQYQSCAVDSLGDTINSQGISCRDNYRMAMVDKIANLINPDNADYLIDMNVSSSFSKNYIRATDGYPLYIYVNPKDDIYSPDIAKDIHIRLKNGAYYYIVYSLCSPVIEPVSLNDTPCDYHFPDAGTLHSDPAHTAYFYIPFNKLGELTQKDETTFGSYDYVPTNFVLGACLENKKIYVVSDGDKSLGFTEQLYKMLGENSIQTMGPNPHVISCE